MRLRHPFAQVGTQFRKAFILDPVGPMVLGTIGPVEPGAKGADGSGLGQLLHPNGDGGVAIDPCGDLIGVAKVDPIIVHGHAGATESHPDTGFPSLDPLLRARMDGKHDVVAAGLEDRTHHVLDFAFSGQDLAARSGRQDLPGFQLELNESGGQERRAIRAACPFDSSILAPVRSGDVAGHVDAGGGEVVGQGLGAQ